MNNNKGFNWFFPIAIGAILLFFFSNMNSDSSSNQITRSFIQFSYRFNFSGISCHNDKNESGYKVAK